MSGYVWDFSNNLLINFGTSKVQDGGVTETLFPLAYSNKVGVVSTCGMNQSGYPVHSRYPYLITKTSFTQDNATGWLWSWIAIGY